MHPSTENPPTQDLDERWHEKRLLQQSPRCSNCLLLRLRRDGVDISQKESEAQMQQRNHPGQTLSSVPERQEPLPVPATRFRFGQSIRRRSDRFLQGVNMMRKRRLFKGSQSRRTPMQKAFVCCIRFRRKKWVKAKEVPQIPGNDRCALSARHLIASEG